MSLPGKLLELKGQQLVLCPQKAVFWIEERALIVADLHIGKVGHFRKAGIAIPKLLEQEDLAVLSDLVDALKPEKIIFLGDLFHSEMNNDWAWLELWRSLFKNIQMILVRGNHDILNDDYYLRAGFTLYDSLYLQPFVFSHEPAVSNDGHYVISGHIHPAVRLKGRGRQSLTLPCFYFSGDQAVIPAFGRFTGKFCISVTQSDTAFVVLNDTIIKV